MSELLPKPSGEPERVCPQCGNATATAQCPIDGWATIPRDRIGTIMAAPSDVHGRWKPGALVSHDGPLSLWGGVDTKTGAAVRIAVVQLVGHVELADIARIQRAAKALEDLAHPRIAKTLATGIDVKGDLVIVSEQVPGPTLAEVLRGGSLGPVRTARLGIQLFDALETAHAAGVMHHDLTPERLRILRDAEGEELIVQDLGLADLVRAPHGTLEPDPGQLRLAAARYRAPEQARDRAVTRHADLYAAGAILYEMLTGRPVFDERTSADYLVAHLVKLPERPTLDGVPLEGPLVELVLRCLEKKPWNRPESATSARESLVFAGRDAGTLAAPQVRVHTPSVVLSTAITGASAPPPLPRVRAAERETNPAMPAMMIPPPPLPIPQAVPEPMPATGPTKRPISETRVVMPLVRRRSTRWPLLAAAMLLFGVGAWALVDFARDSGRASNVQGERAPFERVASAPAPLARPPELAPQPKAQPVVAPAVEAPNVAVAPPPEPVPVPVSIVAPVFAPAEKPVVVEKPAATKPVVAKVDKPVLDNGEPREAPPKRRNYDDVPPASAPRTEASPVAAAAHAATPPADTELRAVLGSEPAGAVVKIGGAARGTTPLTVTWDPGEQLTAQILMEGYEPAYVSFDNAAANKMRQVKLVKARDLGDKPLLPELGRKAPTVDDGKMPEDAPEAEPPKDGPALLKRHNWTSR